MTLPLILILWVLLVLLVLSGAAAIYVLLAQFTLTRAKARFVDAETDNLEHETAWRQADRVNAGAKTGVAAKAVVPNDPFADPRT